MIIDLRLQVNVNLGKVLSPILATDLLDGSQSSAASLRADVRCVLSERLLARIRRAQEVYDGG